MCYLKQHENILNTTINKIKNDQTLDGVRDNLKVLWEAELRWRAEETETWLSDLELLHALLHGELWAEVHAWLNNGVGPWLAWLNNGVGP